MRINGRRGRMSSAVTRASLLVSLAGSLWWAGTAQVGAAERPLSTSGLGLRPDKSSTRSGQSPNLRLAALPLAYDLVVVGGGSGGFGAALAATRLGLQVALVERADCLGGTAVRSGVNCWEPGAGGTGIPFDVYRRLRQIPQAVGIYSHNRHMVWFQPAEEKYRFPGGETVIDPGRRYLDTLRRCGLKGLSADRDRCRAEWHGVVFEPDAMAQTMRAMLDETRCCRIFFRTTFTAVQVRDGRLESLTLDTGQTLAAAFFIDATGDGALCVAAGCRAMTGQEARATFDEPDAPPAATNKVNGATLLYRVTAKATPGVEPLPADVPAKCWWRGGYPVSQMNHYPNGDLNINMLPSMEGEEFLRLGADAAYAECRRRVAGHWHDLQTRFEEFRRYRLVSVAPALGVRESRRIVGQYVLTENDLLAGISRQQHPDVICLADHVLDTHGSHSRGHGELREPYGVPYRCLIPQGFRNMLIACRAASFSSLAASSCRLSRTMMQLGQAAGTAAVLAKELHVDLPAVPAERLRTRLRDQHVQLEHPLPETLRTWLAAE